VVNRWVEEWSMTVLDSMAARTVAPAEQLSRKGRAAAAPTRPAVAYRAGGITGTQFLLAADTGCAVGVTALLHGVAGFTVLAAVATLLAFRLLGLYRPRLLRSGLDDSPRIVGGSLMASAATAFAWTEITASAPGLRDVVTALVVAGSLLVTRMLAYRAIVAWRRRRVARPTLVLGAGVIGGRLGASMVADPGLGLKLVGFLDDDPLLDDDELGAPVLGTMASLAHAIVTHRVTNVFVAFGTVRSSDMVEVLRTCDRLSCEIFFVPRLFELHALTSDTDEINGLPIVRARRATFRSRRWALKRVFDLVVSTGALAVLSPLFAVCVLAVRFEGGRGISFRQARVGLDGKQFDIVKFRSLAPVSLTESQTKWNVSLDDRLRPVGRFLRRTSLDELPQLFNVVRGEMSLVGPRPERPHFVHQFRAAYPSYHARTRVPAGITGLAAVNGLRGDTSIEERARYDNVYIENWSLWLDVKILLRTVVAVLRRTGL